jgi:D-alanine-D-alanine ligase
MELQSKSEFFDYTAKYTAGQTQHIYPADIPEDIYQLALDSALKIHQRLGCRSISRSDFRYNPETNQLFFLEINTHPGLTAISILPEIASYHNMSFSDVLELLIEQAQCEK